MAGATYRDARLPLLLFPGLLCGARLWRDQVEALSATVRCVVADCTQDDALDAMTERATSDRVGPAAYLRQQAAIVARPDSCPDLPRVAVGGDDQLAPPDLAAEIAGLVPGDALRVVGSAGALLPMERPGAAVLTTRRPE